MNFFLKLTKIVANIKCLKNIPLQRDKPLIKSWKSIDTLKHDSKIFLNFHSFRIIHDENFSRISYITP